MSWNQFSELRRYLHFVDNNSEHDKEDKLFKIRPIIEAVRNQCIKIKPEEFQSVDEQIIPSKTRFTKIRQYNPKKPKKWGFKNLVHAGSSGFMYDFYLYSGKETTNNDVPYNHLQKSAQVVAKLCQELPGQKGHKLFFEYRIEVKTTRWYIKVFWHMVDIAKVNSWLLYRRHQNQLNIPLKKPKTLSNFTKEIAAGLMHTNKSLTEAKGCGRPKCSSIEASRHGGKKPAIATPCSDVRFDQYGHWPIPTQDKKRCRLCQSYSRITCEKCGIHLCLNGSRNCFKTFHHK